MKRSIKIGSVLLAVLMFVTSLTVGFSAFAADRKYEDFISAVKDGKNTADPDYEYYVKDLENYTVENKSDKWSTEGNTLSYKHSVTAKDNSSGLINAAAQRMYSIVDDLQSFEYGVGSYNTSLIAQQIKETLYPMLSGKDHMLRTDSSGNKLYVAPKSVTVNNGMEEPIVIDEYQNATVRASVFPLNASDKTVFYRVVKGSEYIAVDQSGRIYTKQPTPEGYTCVIECIAVDSLDLVSPAVYDEDGKVVKAPVIDDKNAVKCEFSVQVKNIDFLHDELVLMLKKYVENPDEVDIAYGVDSPAVNAELERLIYENNLKTLPDYELTAADIAASLSKIIPANLEADEASAILDLLDKEERTDADYKTLASFCYSAVQEKALADRKIDISAVDLANMSSVLSADDVTALREIISDEAKSIYEKCGYTDEYEFFNFDTLVNYFLGNSNVINAANWYHSFEFTVKTDLETAMNDVFDRFGTIADVQASTTIDIITNTYSWQHTREFDVSGTKARYVLKDGYDKSTDKYTETDAFADIAQVHSVFSGLSSISASDTANWDSSDAKAQNDVYRLDAAMKQLWSRNYSSALLAKAFGNEFYWINSIYNQCRPNYAYDQARANRVQYPELYAYRENVRSNPDGSNVPYAMTSDKVNAITGTIDSLLMDENLGKIISAFVDFSDPKYLGSAVYGQSFNNAQEMLQLFIQDMLYTGSLPTLVMQKLYPLLCDLLEKTLPDLLRGISVPLLGNLESIIDGVNDGDDDNVSVTVTRALNSAGIYIYPYEMAEDWKIKGYDQVYPEIYRILSKSSLIPSERKNVNTSSNPKGWDYTGDRSNVGWDKITEEEWDIITRSWNVSNRSQFVQAISTACSSLLPLLKTVLGNQYLGLNAIGFTINVKQLELYEHIFAPLLMSLGVTNAKTVAEFNQSCVAADGREILYNILNPLLDWVEQEVLVHPIQSVAELLVNLPSLLTYKGEDPEAAKNYDGFVDWAVHQIVHPESDNKTGLVLDLVIAVTYSIEVLNSDKLYSLITDNLGGGAALASLNGILGQFVKFKAPIVNRYDEYGEPVFQRTIYDEATGDPISVTETKDKALADTNPVSLPPIQEGKLKEAGNLINRYVSPIDGKTYSNVMYSDVQAGQILMFLFRYIFYGIMNTEYSYDGTWNNPTLLDCFLDPWSRDGELLAGSGLSINSIINNIVYNPEAALCALMELFAPNEQGGFNIEDNVYKLAYPDYQQKILLERDEKGNLKHKTFGANVKYTKYWTRASAEDTVNNLKEIVANVLQIMGMGSLEDLLSGLIEDNLYTNKILSMLGSGIYNMLQGLQTNIDIQTILDAAFGIRVDVSTLYNTLAYNMCLKYGFTEISDMPVVLRTMLSALNRATMDQPVEWSESLFYEDAYLVDENGDPVMETVIVTDENGNKVQMIDENGQPMVDEDGNPIYKTEEKQKIEKKPLDWGLGENENGKLVDRVSADGTNILTKEEVFFDALTALLSPLTLLLQRILLGQNLSVLTSEKFPNGLLTIPMYQIYHYALIPLFEALGMPNIVSHNNIVKRIGDKTVITTAGTKFAPNGVKTGVTQGDINFFEDLLSPVRGLIDKVLADPIGTVFDLIPNLMFIISAGTINGIINNVAHFAYVLLDILKPIVDAVPVVNKLIGGLEVMNIKLNISLPLDIDFNTIVNQLIGSFTQGTVVEGALQGTGGIEVTKGLFIKLPPLDLSMLCCGLITAYNSVSGNEIVKIGTGDGADLITVLLTFVMDTLFMYDNTVNISVFLANLGQMDGFDSETIFTVLTSLNKMANEDEMPDKAMNIIYLLLKYVAPISGTLAEKLSYMPNGTDKDGNPVYGMSITEFIDALKSGDDPLELVKTLITAKSPGDQTVSPVLSFFDRLKLFFQRLIAAIKALFRGL